MCKYARLENKRKLHNYLRDTVYTWVECHMNAQGTHFGMNIPSTSEGFCSCLVLTPIFIIDESRSGLIAKYWNSAKFVKVWPYLVSVSNLKA